MMKRFLVVPLLLLFPLLTPAQNKIAVRPIGQAIVSFSATPVFDASISSTFKITLTANVTSSTVIGMEAGQELTCEICQDGVGSRTFAWPALMVGPIAILAGVNVCTVETFHYDGTSAYIWTTTTAGGGGSGTVNSGTSGHPAYYGANGTTVSSLATLDDNITNALALTYSGANGIFATQYNSTASGAFTMVGTEGTVSGAASGKDVLACGDVTSHSCQISNNGDSFRSIAVHESTSPTPFGPMMAGTFPQTHTVSAGLLGQALISGGPTGFGGYGALDASGGSNFFINRFPKANLLTSVIYNDQVNTGTSAFTMDGSAATGATAWRIPNVAGATSTTNGVQRYDTTSNNYHFGMNGADAIVGLFTSVPADSRCLQSSVVSGNLIISPAAGACSTPGGNPPINNIIAATASNTPINNGDFAQQWNWQATTSGRRAFVITENSASTCAGSCYLHDIHSIAASTANPLIVTALGTANGWNLLNSGALWAPVGTGGLAIPGSAKGVVVSQGPSAANTTVTGSLNQLITFDAGGNPIAADPIISYNYVNIWTAQDVTVTRTSAAVRNPIFSQTGTLQLTWASITGSPATCTLQVQGVDSVGNALNNGSTFSVSPANGVTSQTFTAAAALQSAAQIKAIFACVTYPTTGTLTLDFTPIPNVNVTNTVTAALAAGSALVGKVGIDQTTPGTTNAVSATNLPTTADTNSGNKSASTLRVVIATDQPALTNKLLVTPDSVALPANQSVNESQINGVTPLMGNGVAGTGAQRVTISSDNTPFESIPVATATTTDATSTCYLTSAASTNSTNCKASAGNVYGVYVINTTTTNYFLRMYNSASAPTCSSATGFIETIPILGGAANGGGISRMQMAQGYSTGIGFCVTGGGSSTDNTNAATGVYITVLYK